MEWSQEVVFEFIDAYENEPVIPGHPQHKNRNCVNDAWLRIKNKLSNNNKSIPFRNWEDSMDEDETEEASLTKSASAIGDGGAYADIRKHTDIRENDSNENEATVESASANKEGGIGKSTDSNQKHFKAPLGGAKKSKRKAIDMDETERRMKEAYDIKQSQNTDPPKTTLCTAYGTTMGYLGPQYQSTASLYSSSFHTTPSIASLLTINSLPQHSATSSSHQSPRAPVIPTPTDNDIQYLPSRDNYTCL
ncbi:hypothetical protein FQA39_LY13606 [Lamprigera yunnana]|nr:hypothetical protein FQA39_LY13606 [Lamprigera yunnana]